MSFDSRDFLAPRLSPRKLDVYGLRRSILAALTRTLPDLSGVVLDVGCGDMPYKPLILAKAPRVQRYVGMDLATTDYAPPELVWDGVTIPLPDASVDCALATEVLEHCEEPERLLREAVRVLVPGGLLFFTVPFLWPLHSTPHDQYRYTPFALERHLRNSGFDEVRIETLGNWDASLAQMIGLWVMRRPMPGLLRRILALGAQPLVAALVASDTVAGQPFTDNRMPPGLAGTARKPRG